MGLNCFIIETDRQAGRSVSVLCHVQHKCMLLSWRPLQKSTHPLPSHHRPTTMSRVIARLTLHNFSTTTGSHQSDWFRAQESQPWKYCIGLCWVVPRSYTDRRRLAIFCYSQMITAGKDCTLIQKRQRPKATLRTSIAAILFNKMYQCVYLNCFWYLCNLYFSVSNLCILPSWRRPPGWPKHVGGHCVCNHFQ